MTLNFCGTVRREGDERLTGQFRRISNHRLNILHSEGMILLGLQRVPLVNASAQATTLSTLKP